MRRGATALLGCGLLASCSTDLVLTTAADAGAAPPMPRPAQVLLGPDTRLVFAGERRPDDLATDGERWIATQTYRDEVLAWDPDAPEERPWSLPRWDLDTAFPRSPGAASRCCRSHVVPFGSGFLVSAEVNLLSITETGTQSHTLVGYDGPAAVVADLLPWGDDALAEIWSSGCERILIGADLSAEGILPCDGSPSASTGSEVISVRPSGARAMEVDAGGRWSITEPLAPSTARTEAAVATGTDQVLAAWREEDASGEECRLSLLRLRLADGSRLALDRLAVDCGRGLSAVRVGDGFAVAYGARTAPALVRLPDGGELATVPLPAPCQPPLLAAGSTELRLSCPGRGGLRVEGLELVPAPLSRERGIGTANGSVLHAACAADACLVVSDEGGYGEAFRIRRPDGALLDPALISLGPCRGPVASDGDGFMVGCDGGAVRVYRDGSVDPVGGGLDGARPIHVVWRDDRYVLLALQSEIDPGRGAPRLFHVAGGAGGVLQAAPCCGLAEPIAGDAVLISTDDALVLAWSSVPADVSRVLHMTWLGEDGSPPVTRPVCEGMCARPLAIGGIALVVDAPAGTGHFVDLASGEVEVRPVSLPGEPLQAVEDSYYLFTGQRFIGGVEGVFRVGPDGTAVGDDGEPRFYGDPVTDVTAVVALSASRLVLLGGSPLRMRVAEYREP
jgi:hypothetical protein